MKSVSNSHITPLEGFNKCVLLRSLEFREHALSDGSSKRSWEEAEMCDLSLFHECAVDI